MQNKALVLIDKFKGSLTQVEVNKVVSRALQELQIQHQSFLMADGGDGSLTTLSSIGWRLHSLKVTGPVENQHEAKYATSPDGEILALELSELCGIKYLGGIRSPYESHTRAIGEAIKKVSSQNWSELWLLLGGSASNDGGLGILQGLGIKVFDSKGRVVKSGLNGLQQAASIESSALEKVRSFLNGRRVVLVADVGSPLLGRNGALATFGRQKGLGARGQLRGEVTMRRWRRLVDDATKSDTSSNPGAGAAGGVGFLAFSFFCAEYRSGASLFLELNGATAAVDSTSTVLTGEGQIDASSLSGKCVLPILEIVRTKNAKAILVCGSYDEGVLKQLQGDYPVIGVVALSDSGLKKSDQISRASEILYSQLKLNLKLSWFSS